MNNLKKLSLVAVWVAVTACLGLAACSGTDAPAAFDPSSTNDDKDAGKGGNNKGDSAKDNPPPRPIDSKPDPVTPDDAPVPQITSISPEKGVLNDVGPTITVNGALFVARSKVLVDGVDIPTSFVSDTELNATIPDDKLKAVAQLKVSVTTSAPGGGTSNEAVFAVENPKPELTGMSPLSVATGAGNTLITLTGKNFVPGSKVRFGNKDVGSTTKSDTKIEATIASTEFSKPGSFPVHVTNPFPGGGVTADLAFTVSNPAVNITSISPPSTTINASSATITVKGSGFVETTVVKINGVAVSTTREASDSLRATVPGSELTVFGGIPVAVETPGVGPSNALSFYVVYPAPTISFSGVDPSSVSAGDVPPDVKITGNLFFPTSKITFDGVPTATEFIDAKHLQAKLTAAQIAKSGTIDVKVVNPTLDEGGGGGPSTETRSITVKNGTPQINAFDPAAVSAVPSGGPVTKVTIRGARFVEGTTAKATVDTDPPVTETVDLEYKSGSELVASVPASLLGSRGKGVSFQLKNPSPGGTSSGGPKLQVLCDSTGVNVHLNATTTDTLVPDYNANKISRWAATGGTCPQETVPEVEQPVNYVVVQNSTLEPLLVTAWGVCEAGKGDGFLAFYNKDKAPQSEAERKACYGSVSEGGSLKSPEANGADRCPGLTKENGGATLKLAACERAVIQLQSFSKEDPNNPPPKQLKVKGERP